MLVTEEIPAFGVLIVLFAFSFILNGTFIIVICKNWTLVKRRRVTYHVTSIAISDSLVGASGFCKYIAIVATGKNPNSLSKVFSEIGWMAALTSLLAVCLMAIERLLCIKKPLTWNEILSLKRILRIMVGNWALALSLTILVYFYPWKMRIFFGVLCYILIFVTALVYINMYIRISKSSKVDETQQSSSIGERLNKLMQRKVGNLVLILALVLVITMKPILIFDSVKAACKLSNCKFLETMNTLVAYSYLLVAMNFVVNPILYAWRIRLYRQAFWKMLGRANNENKVLRI